jgi:uncharacterized protein (DUF1501 family)
MSKSVNRRQFLKVSALGLVGAALSGPGGINISRAFAFGPLASQRTFTDYKALVCVFLFGGNDSFNNFVPSSTAEYNIYAQSRQNLAIPQDILLSVNPLTPDGASYGFHPAMTEMRDLFESGHLAVIANVGPMIEPVTKESYEAQSVALPPQLFSHNDQQQQWQAADQLDELKKTGWAGRMADLLASANANRDLSMNITTSGHNLWQVGDVVIPYSVSTQGAVTLTGLFGGSNRQMRRRQAFEFLLNKTNEHVFEEEYARIQSRGMGLADSINTALASLPALSTVFPASNLADQLQMVARLIGIRDDLGVSRQMFFVGTGGYDTHDDQEQRQPVLLQTLSQALSAFYAALSELGAGSKVTTFTMSDFGRTLTSNGDGTDHAWGGHQFVMGDAVVGRDIYGTMPSLAIGGPDDTRGGRIIPTIAVDQYGATLGRWFGVTEPELDQVFPNLVNFSARDLGFL